MYWREDRSPSKCNFLSDDANATFQHPIFLQLLQSVLLDRFLLRCSQFNFLIHRFVLFVTNSLFDLRFYLLHLHLLLLHIWTTTFYLLFIFFCTTFCFPILLLILTQNPTHYCAIWVYLLIKLHSLFCGQFLGSDRIFEIFLPMHEQSIVVVLVFGKRGNILVPTHKHFAGGFNFGDNGAAKPRRKSWIHLEMGLFCWQTLCHQKLLLHQILRLLRNVNQLDFNCGDLVVKSGQFHFHEYVVFDPFDKFFSFGNSAYENYIRGQSFASFRILHCADRPTNHFVQVHGLLHDSLRWHVNTLVHSWVLNGSFWFWSSYQRGRAFSDFLWLSVVRISAICHWRHNVLHEIFWVKIATCVAYLSWRDTTQNIRVNLWSWFHKSFTILCLLIYRKKTRIEKSLRTKYESFWTVKSDLGRILLLFVRCRSFELINILFFEPESYIFDQIFIRVIHLQCGIGFFELLEKHVVIGILHWVEYIFWKMMQRLFGFDKAEKEFTNVVPSKMLLYLGLGQNNSIINTANRSFSGTNIHNASCLSCHRIRSQDTF